MSECPREHAGLEKAMMVAMKGLNPLPDSSLGQDIAALCFGYENRVRYHEALGRLRGLREAVGLTCYYCENLYSVTEEEGKTDRHYLTELTSVVCPNNYLKKKIRQLEESLGNGHGGKMYGDEKKVSLKFGVDSYSHSKFVDINVENGQARLYVNDWDLVGPLERATVPVMKLTLTLNCADITLMTLNES